MRPQRLLALALLLIFEPALAAAPPVPAPLAPWVDWVLADHPDVGCTWAGEARRCAWSPALEVRLDGTGGTFEQRWTIESDQPRRVALPRAPGAEPFEVRLDGRPAVVVGKGGRALLVPPGSHTVSGRLAWDTLPSRLEVPAGTAVVRGLVAGRPIPPQAPGTTALPLRDDASQAAVADRMEVRVFRRLWDDVPMQIDTVVHLRVSGRRRLVSLPGMALPGTRLMSVSGGLPARLLEDGSLEIEVRAGEWTVETSSRHVGPAETLALPAEATRSEVWVYAASDKVTPADVAGPPSLDPRQTGVPEAWWMSRGTYLVAPGQAVHFARQAAGLTPEQDALTLVRHLWLDFDGSGLTAVDRIEGTTYSKARLEATPLHRLGRVRFLDEAQGAEGLISQGPGGARGVQLPSEEVKVEAFGRYERSDGPFAASGWQRTFESAKATLHLAPGWTLFHASGVDEADTWLSRWNILEVFLVLVFTLSFRRLWGWRWGLVALAGLLLLMPEASAPRWLWAAVLAMEALVRVAPAGWGGRGLLRGVRAVVLTVLVIWSLVYVGEAVQTALHPALGADPRMPRKDVAEETAQADVSASLKREKALEVTFFAEAEDGTVRPPEPDPDMVVQTGPGRPGWEGRWHRLRWSGPLSPGQSLRLWIWPPWLTGLLKLLSALLLGLLVARALGGRRGSAAGSIVRGVVVLALCVAPGASQAQAPSPELLKALEDRLTAPPTCHPQCGALQAAEVAVAEGRLTLDLDLHVAERAALPLPSVVGWGPERVLVGGRRAEAVAAQGERLWVALGPGRHRVRMTGPVAPLQTLEVDFPLAPAQQVLALDEDWDVASQTHDGLRLEQRPEVLSGTSDLAQVSASPVFEVFRTIHIGQTWSVNTQVLRRIPREGLSTVVVPLLPGEAPLSQEVGPGGVRISDTHGFHEWTSALSATEALTLTAPDRDGWTETWTVKRDPAWEVGFEGAAPQGFEAGPSVLTWHPWPGQTVTLHPARVTPVAGRHLTVDEATLKVWPGRRGYDAQLAMTLRTSLAGTHPITLPEGATLQSVALGGETVDVRQEGRTVALPLYPGTHTWEVIWRADLPLGPAWRVPPVDLGAEAANLQVEVAPSSGRWLIWVTAPGAGPVVRLWALLAVVLAVGIVLRRTRLTPLGLADWLLLGLAVLPGGIWPAVIVSGWLLALGWRARAPELDSLAFDARQVALVGLTGAALGALAVAVANGLLDQPSSYVAGMGSNASRLVWFVDRSSGPLPQPVLFTLPLWVWRGAMLLWALWLAVRVLGWLRWGFDAFRLGGTWRALSPKRRGRAAAAGVPVAEPVEPEAP